jgi:hypothetical protein
MAGKTASNVSRNPHPKTIPSGMIVEDCPITVGARTKNPKLTIQSLVPVANAEGVIASVKWLSEVLGDDLGPVFVAQAIRRAIVASQTAQAGSKLGIKIPVAEIGTIVPKLHKLAVVDKTTAAREWLMDQTKLAMTGDREMPTVDEISEKFKGLTL